MLDRQGEITKLPFIDPVGLSVSPDGTTIGWYVGDVFSWWKTSGISGTVELPSSDTSWWWLRQWLANDRVILGHEPSNREAGDPTPAIDEFAVLSLSSGTLTTYQLTMSRLFGTAAQTFGLVLYPTYDPFLKYTLYTWQDTENQWGQGKLLWDIEAQREAWILGDWQWPIEATGIDWRLDGSAVAITAHALEATSEYLAPEMIMVDTHGNATQLTDIYHSGRIAPGNFHLLRRPKWSPDGRYLAFVLDQENMGYSESQSGSLLIYDTVEERLLDYCIASVYYPGEDMIAWSPTSEQIAFSIRAKGKDGRYFISDVLVLDVTTGQLGSVFDGSPYGLLRGWLAFDVP
jgi:hypothetical protein